MSTTATPIVFYEGWDDLDWAQPGDHLIPAEDPYGEHLVMDENGQWVRQ